MRAKPSKETDFPLTVVVGVVEGFVSPVIEGLPPARLAGLDLLSRQIIDDEKEREAMGATIVRLDKAMAERRRNIVQCMILSRYDRAWCRLHVDSVPS